MRFPERRLEIGDLVLEYNNQAAKRPPLRVPPEGVHLLVCKRPYGTFPDTDDEEHDKSNLAHENQNDNEDGDRDPAKEDAPEKDWPYNHLPTWNPTGLCLNAVIPTMRALPSADTLRILNPPKTDRGLRDHIGVLEELFDLPPAAAGPSALGPR